MKKVLALFLSLIFVLTAFIGCSKEPLDKIKSTKQELSVVGTVGNNDILYEELRCLTLGFRDRMEWTYGDDIWKNAEKTEKYREQLEEYVMFAIIVNSAVLKVAADNGISPDDKEVKKYLELKLSEQASELAQNLSIQNGDSNYSPSRKEINEAYKKFLAENHLTDNYYRYVLSIDGCIELLKQKLIQNGTLTSDDDSIINYVNENFVRTIHVYIPFDPETDFEEATNRAELVDWILQNNFKFDSKKDDLKEKLGITEETSKDSPIFKFFNRITEADTEDEKMNILVGSSYNKDMTISQNGYYFSYGEFDVEYEKAAMLLEIGETGRVVKCQDGYYIIRRLELDDDYIIHNLDTLKTQYHMSYINKLIDEAEATLNFKFNDYGKTLDLTKIK